MPTFEGTAGLLNHCPCLHFGYTESRVGHDAWSRDGHDANISDAALPNLEVVGFHVRVNVGNSCFSFRTITVIVPSSLHHLHSSKITRSS